MGGYSNPFDRPLDSEVGEHQQAHAATTQASPIGNPFDEPLLSEKAENRTQETGEQTNDVGNTVIVPKDGESFADTMSRAAAQGKKTTPEQINKEIATAPGKAATVLAAAPVMGAAGAAALSGVAEPFVSPGTQTAMKGSGFLMQEVEAQLPSAARELVNSSLQKLSSIAGLPTIAKAGIAVGVLKALGVKPSHITHLLGLTEEGK